MEILEILKHSALFWTFVFAFGAIFGSFFNCVIYRLPRGLSLVWPSSYCPNCRNPIAFYDNIPLFSYFFLGGHCRCCRQPIAFRYFVVEAATTIATLLLVYWLVVAPKPIWELLWALSAAVFLLALIPITWIDLEHRIIPDVFTIPAAGLGMAVSFFPGGITPLNALAGLLAGGGVLYAVGWVGEVALRKGEAMGGGDVKMMAAAGAFLGAKSVLLGLFVGSILGSVAGISILALKGWKSDHRIAFGPYLAAGIVIVFFGSRQILDAYSRFILYLAQIIAR